MATYTALDDAGGPISAVQFTLLLSAASRTAEAAVDVRHVTGGNNNFLDLGGQMTPTIEGEGLFADYVTLTTMESFCGGVGILDYAEGILNVVLYKVARKKVTGRGPQYAALSFKII